MKIMIVGGAGLMGRIIGMDLVESKGVDEIVIADYFEERAKEVATSLNDSRVSGCFINAKDIDAMASLMERYDAVINSTLPSLNLSIMKACLKAHCHYNDLGGLFHVTLKQLELFNDFKEAGLSAALCIGSAPGITNIMARYAYDRLDSVDTVRLFVASVDLNEMEGLELFIPPYSIRTVMDEYYLESVQFIDGEFKTVPPLAGEMEMVFPDPIGKALCHHTLHSEPALLSKSFKDKGVKEVTWRLSLPPKFEYKSIFLASIGFADEEAIQVNGQSIYPKDVLEAIVERYLKEKIQKAGIKSRRLSCVRAQVTGEKDGKSLEYTLDCMNTPHSRWGVMCGTSVPPSIAAQLQVTGLECGPGVWAPEMAFDPKIFFAELAKRELNIHITRKEQFI